MPSDVIAFLKVSTGFIGLSIKSNNLSKIPLPAGPTPVECPITLTGVFFVPQIALVVFSNMPPRPLPTSFVISLPRVNTPPTIPFGIPSNLPVALATITVVNKLMAALNATKPP